ncbi:MAG: hypothetical protein ACK6AH_07365 [Gemmatimonadota bacterium]
MCRHLTWLLVGAACSTVASAQAGTAGRVSLPTTVQASVPAVAVVSALTAPDGDAASRGRRRWRAVVRTGANDRHDLRRRGLLPEWTVQHAGVALAPSPGGDIVIAERLARGYHEVVVLLDGPQRQPPAFEAVVRTVQVSGGLATASLATGPADGILRRP